MVSLWSSMELARSIIKLYWDLHDHKGVTYHYGLLDLQGTLIYP